MGRKTATFTATEGRDKGKHFLLTEMSASQGESWAMRVLLALMGSNVDLPEGFESLGMAGLAELGMRALAGLRWEIAEPLLKEMFTCVQVIPDIKRPTIIVELFEPGEDYHIEEISTRLQLRAELWKLHMGFLEAVAPSLSARLKGAAAKRESHIKA